MESIPKNLRGTQWYMVIDESETIKTLGLRWEPISDTFSFKLNLDINQIHTKRSLLSEISKIYDPLGFLQPTTIKAKILMQEIWKTNIDWDDKLPADIQEAWMIYAANLPKIEAIRIPRCLHFNERQEFELHGFADASEKAYAAVIYVREINSKGTTLRFVTAKTKVAPLQIMTIPRLELQAAVLLANLMDHVTQTWNVKFKETHFWTDSKIVLDWVHSSPTRFKIFIANRIQQIQDVSQANQWHHVASEDNPADCASRGIGPEELEHHSLWWNGPQFLASPDYVITSYLPSPDKTGEEKTQVLSVRVARQEDYILQSLIKISSWKRIIRVMTIVLSVLTLNSLFRGFQAHVGCGPSPSEFSRAEMSCISLIQKASFIQLMNEITSSSNISNRYLRSLAPFIDSSGIVRVGGRLSKADMPEQSKHPALIPGSHSIIQSLIRYIHLEFAHAGQATILHHLQEKYWMIGAKKCIRKVIDQCVLCFKFKAQPTTQFMAELPAARVNLTRAFLHTGVDNAGPFEIKNFSGNRATKIKVWITLFTCMATRAIHLELCTAMTYECFLHAFCRFISRRGRPSDMYSDCGLNFVGANNFLVSTAESLAELQKAEDSLLPDLSIDKINWHFNPPRAPHQGGAWESCVKLVKNYLKKLMVDESYTFEQLETILVFTEALVNSRPLTAMSTDPNDLQALTPAHFLIGTSLLCFPEHSLLHLNTNRMDMYQKLQHHRQTLWVRWQKEYLTTLQQRSKWDTKADNLKVGDMVLILDELAKPLNWKLGRVTATHPGEDGVVRITTVETEGNYQEDKKGVIVKTLKSFTRPITKLAKLPIYEYQEPLKDEACDHTA